jgi:hypothetical protein
VISDINIANRPTSSTKEVCKMRWSAPHAGTASFKPFPHSMPFASLTTSCGPAIPYDRSRPLHVRRDRPVARLFDSNNRCKFHRFHKWVRPGCSFA